MKQKLCNKNYILIAAVITLFIAVISCVYVSTAAPDAYAASAPAVTADTGTATKFVGDYTDEFGSAYVADYDIADRTFADADEYPIPRLDADDVKPENYGKSSDNVTLSLRFNNVLVKSNFKRDEFAECFNQSAPAGSYELTLSAGSIQTTVNFEIAPRSLSKALNGLDTLLTNKTFTYLWDNASHLYDSETAASVDEILNNYIVKPTRTGVWTNDEMFGDVFGEVELQFNLARMQNDSYSAEVYTAAPDKYTVFYKLAAPNYKDTALYPEEYKTRTDYKFYVVNVQEVELPQISAKPYNGENQKADVHDGYLYTVKANEGGTNAGEYDVVLSLRNPEYQMWQGQTLEDWLAADNSADITLKFEISQASNGWSVLPSVSNWVEGKYDSELNGIVGSARYGAAVIRITDVDGKVEYYNSATGVNKLKDAKAGVYSLVASIQGDSNYLGLVDYTYNFRILRKPGIPVWGTLLIVFGALAAAAIVIIILWRAGVFSIITDKILLGIRTRASVEATIAAVRANKRAEQVRAAQARAEAEERARVRREAAEAEQNMTPEELAASLKEKAKATAERAKKMQVKAREMRNRAEEVAAAAAAAAEPDQIAAVTPEAETAAAESEE